jgi:dihydrofolate synthase/folylpolyglutamate synthase
MTYPDAIDYLHGLRMFAAAFGLDNTRRLTALVGEPQQQLRFIHVAGTNGKGSTCAMLEAVYRASGLRVGLFTSPHLVSFRERLQINRRLIPEADLARLVAALCEKNRGGAVTLFEFTTVLALMWFAEQHCDLVIWETGLGGRLDATNIVTPLASVITNIAFDHEQWLGHTLAQIAAEKAGIIKPGVPVLTTADAPEALAVIAAVAQKNGSPLIQIPSAIAESTIPSLSPTPGDRQEGRPPCPAADPIPEPLSLRGRHQLINAALARATIGALQAQLRVSPAELRTGLATVSWPGRLQLITHPDGSKILLDGAHNAAGAGVLRLALETEFAGPRPLLIFGSLADKNWPVICRILAPLADRFLTVPVASKRTADPRELAAALRAANPAAEVTVCPGLPAALATAQHADFVLITGSLYLIGEALDRLGLAQAGPGERGLNEWQGDQNQH